MNAANVDLENLMFRLNAQAMEIVSLRQLLESSVVRDPWLIAVINLVHEHHGMGYGGTDVTIGNFPDSGEGHNRFEAHDHGWIFGETGKITLEHMMASIPKLCAMGLHILVLEPGCLSCPFTIHWETPDDLDEIRLRRPDMVYHPPTGPCAMFGAASGDE
jgi:hypothetical protein